MISPYVMACDMVYKVLKGRQVAAAPEDIGLYAEVVQMMGSAATTEAALECLRCWSDHHPELTRLEPTPAWLADSVSLAQLRAMPTREPTWVVKDLIPAGMSLLAGRPKQGKSYLSLQAASAIGSGGVFLNIPVQRRQVLFVALEDSAERLQRRLDLMDVAVDANVHFLFDMPSFKDCGIGFLHNAMASGELGLVVVDTYSRAAGHMDHMDISETTGVLAPLQEVALRNNVALILVDHFRKSGADGKGDAVEDLIGSSAKTAVADAVIGLYRDRGMHDAKLTVTGRDLAEHEITIRFDEKGGGWHVQTDASGVRVGTVQEQILTAMQEMGGEATAADLARRLDKKPGNITREFGELLAKGRIVPGEAKGNAQPYRLVEE